MWFLLACIRNRARYLQPDTIYVPDSLNPAGCSVAPGSQYISNVNPCFLCFKNHKDDAIINSLKSLTQSIKILKY